MRKGKKAYVMGRKFKKLDTKVTREYEHKGYGRKRARYIGGAVAGKIYREKKRKSY